MSKLSFLASPLAKDRRMVALKLALVFAGSILSAYGITMAIGADFGAGTLAVLWQGISVSSGMTLGQASFLVAVVMLAFTFFYDKHQIGIGTIVYQIVYSFMVDVFSGQHYAVGVPLFDFAVMLLGIVLFAVGTGTYAATDFGKGSYEAVTFAIVGRTGKSIRLVRMTQDALTVMAGVLLGGTIGWCTLCVIVLSGPVIQKSAVFTKRLFHLTKDET